MYADTGGGSSAARRDRAEATDKKKKHQYTLAYTGVHPLAKEGEKEKERDAQWSMQYAREGYNRIQPNPTQSNLTQPHPQAAWQNAPDQSPPSSRHRP